MMSFENLTISQIQRGLKAKSFSAGEITRYYLDKTEQSDKDIGAFLTICSELASEQAKKADNLISQGKDLPALAGVPLALKDNILLKTSKLNKSCQKYTIGSKTNNHKNIKISIQPSVKNIALKLS